MPLISSLYSTLFTPYHIDTIRADFNKPNRLDHLKKVSHKFNLKWHKIKKNSSLYLKLRRYLHSSELTSVYQLGDESIYYYNRKIDDKTNKYKRATLVAFGLHQYHKAPPPKELVADLFNKGANNISSVDVCTDISYRPNLEALALTQYKDQPTYYLNHTDIYQIERICIYDKAYKNNLTYPLWRIEATIEITNLHVPSPLSKKEKLELLSKRIDELDIQIVSKLKDLLKSREPQD